MKELGRVLSTERLQTYLTLAQGDKERVFPLYIKNMKLSEKVLSFLHIFEVVHRNLVHEPMKIRHGKLWMTEALFVKGESQKSLHDESDLISSLPFGFWTSLYSPRLEEIWRHDLRKVFPHAVRLKRSDIAKRLASIRHLRNRVAHHECILKSDIHH